VRLHFAAVDIYRLQRRTAAWQGGRTELSQQQNSHTQLACAACQMRVTQIEACSGETL